jgi:hypothetical protein
MWGDAMKFSDVLRGHLPLADDRRKEIWAQADFVFDTNVLLDVYRYTDASRAAFFKLLAALKGRVFVPHQVAIEFARNRLGVIHAHFEPQRLIKKALDEAEKKIKAAYPKHSLLDEFSKLITDAKDLVDQRFGTAEKKHNALLADDGILRELLTIIGEDVGEPYPPEEVDKEYKRRKAGSIPPFCKTDDAKDEERRVGDVAIWLEVLKKYEGAGKPMIFVTDDTKENWWQDSGGGRSEAQPFLVREMFDRAKADLLFYRSERFSERAPSYLGIEVSKDLAKETKEIRQREKIERRMEHDFFNYLLREKTGKSSIVMGHTLSRLSDEELLRLRLELEVLDEARLRAQYQMKHQREGQGAIADKSPEVKEWLTTVEGVIKGVKHEEEPPAGS